MKQIVSPVKGTRDFYPEDFAFREWLYGKIKSVSQSFGYQEFDGPSIEYLDLYSDKTSEEILTEQAFSLKDRDDRTLLLRPEITPTFARMVAQKSQQLLKPVRWFSFAKAWRYEQPQKGRGREFFQWEINLLGPESPEADAEILAIAAQFFQSLGFSPNEVVIRVSDRSYFEQVIDQAGISKRLYMPLLRLIDRREKISEDEFVSAMVDDLKLTTEQISTIRSYINNKDYTKSPWLEQVFSALQNYPQATDYVAYDPIITRGFDYYTRTVFEAWDKTGHLKRALFGGGRFDNLTETLGGEKVPGVGMAPGDMPIQILLQELEKIPDLSPATATVLVTVFNEEFMSNSIKFSAALRANGINTELWPDSESKLDKQLKYADQKGIPYVVISGPDEVKNQQITLKNLASGDQETLSLDEVIAKLASPTV